MSAAATEVLEAYFADFPFRRPRPAMDASAWGAYLDDFRPIARSEAAHRARTLPDFNVWDAVSLRRDEVLHCRLLAWLIDPRGEHGQGSGFARHFLQALHGRGLPKPDDIELDRLRIVTEQPTANDGRIDLVLIGPDLLIAIEAKIGARERANQIRDYAAWLAQEAEARRIPADRRFIVFLARGGVSATSGEAISLSWAEIATACRRLARSSPASGDDGLMFKALLRGFADHLSDHVVKE